MPTIEVPDCTVRTVVLDSRTSVQLSWRGARLEWLGEDEGTGTVFTCLEFSNAEGRAIRVIVLRTAGAESPIVASDDRTVYYAAGREFAVMQRDCDAVIRRLLLNWPVVALVPFGEDSALVIGEVGVARISASGEVGWLTHTPDLVLAWRVEHSTLYLTLDRATSTRFAIDLQTGQERRRPV